MRLHDAMRLIFSVIIIIMIKIVYTIFELLYFPSKMIIIIIWWIYIDWTLWTPNSTAALD